MGQPHKHAELIKAWADGAEIQMRCPDFENWQDMDTPTWHEVLEYRIKPEPPKYPQTKMTKAEVEKIWNSAPKQIGSYEPLYAIANAAIARAIEDGQVVPAEMLENVAKDAAAYGYNQAGGYKGLYLGPDFYDIITRVKEGK